MSRRLISIKNWQVVLLLIVSLMISAWSLRDNNLQMGELRDQVLKVDEADEDIETALNQLGSFIFSHMNTDLNQPVELVHRFNRAVELARLKAAETGSNPKIYAKAQVACERSEIPLTVRAQCIQDYVSENAAPGEVIVELELPTKELYVYDFQSPLWSPDLAGFAVLISGLLGVILLSRTIAYMFLKNRNN